MSLSITDNSNASVEVRDGEFQDDVLTASSGALKKGTILARDSSTLKLVVFVKGGSTNENGIPKAVLTYAVSDNAADLALRVMVKGLVNERLLVIAADGDNSNVDAAVKDQLRDYNIVPVDVAQLARDDNPQDTVDS